MNKWKTKKSLKAENKHLKAENEYVVRKWAVEVIKNQNNVLKNRLFLKLRIVAVIAIGLIISPIIPITSFCSKTGLCPYYSILNPVLTKINSAISERTNWNNTMIDIDNRWLVMMGIWIIGFVVISLIEIYKKDKENKELYQTVDS